MSKKIFMTLVSFFILLSVPWVSSGEESASFDLNTIHSYLYSFSLSDSYWGTAKISTFSFYADKVSLGTFASAKYPSYPEKASAKKIDEGPIDPHRLFIIPEAEVLRSMEVNIGGGSAFGVRKTESRPLLGHVRFGLGDVSEVEVSTQGIINRLAEGSPSIPTAAFKLRFLPEGKWNPSIAGALRSSLWHTEERDTEMRGKVKFQKRLSTLYFVASKTLGKASMHAGVSINDMRIRTRAIDNEPISPNSQWEIDNGRDYYNKNLIGPFLGLRVEVNPKTFLMIEYEQIAKYDFDEGNPELSQKDISTEWLVIAGVRFFFLDWLALDTGVMYRGDYHGIGDALISAGLNINLSLPRVMKSLFRKW